MPCPQSNNSDGIDSGAKQSSPAVQSPQSPKSPCVNEPTGFGAFKQAVTDTGNAILCKTIRRDSDACKKRAEEAQAKLDAQLRAAETDGCSGKSPEQAKKTAEPEPKRTNPMNPQGQEQNWEFVKNFIDKS